MNDVVKLFVTLAAVAWSISGSVACQRVMAQSAPEPVAVISIANLSKITGDIDYLVDASGFGQMKFIIQTQVNQFTNGIDKTRPAGILLYMNEGDEQPSALGFMPVTNLDDVLDNISAFADVDEGEEFTTIITDDEKEFMIKQVGDVAWLSDKPEMFNQLPDAPVGLLGDLPQQYNFSARVFGQRIPLALRQKGLDMIRDAYQDQMDQLEDLKPEEAQLQQQAFEMNMKQVESLMMETEQLSIGMLVDQENQSLAGEMQITGLDGSQIAKSSATNETLPPSKFGGFILPGSAFNGVGSLKLTEDDIQQYQQITSQSRQSLLDSINEEADLTESQLAAVDKAMGSLIEVLNETISRGFIDSGIVVDVTKGNCNAALGVNAANPAKAEEVVRDLSAEFQQELGEKIRVQLDADDYKDVKFHTFAMDTPEDPEEMVDAVGQQLQLAVGIGGQKIYVAFGSQPVAFLKRVLDNSDESNVAPATMGTYDLFIAPILQFAASMDPENKVLGNLAEKLTEMGRDRLRYSMKPIPNGFHGRAELQDAVLSLIKVGVDSMAAQAAGGEDF